MTNDTSWRPVVDLIIPALNEQENISALFAELNKLPRDFIRQIIVADNGSTDETARLAREAGAIVVREDQRGYGAACLAGLNWITESPTPSPDVVAFLDADLADDPSNLPLIIAPIAAGAADMVIASRRRMADPGALTTTQRLGNILACRLIHICTGQRFNDLGPMRALRWESLTALKMEDRTWGWTVEMQYKAAVIGLRCTDVHLPYRRRYAGPGKISGTVTGSVKAGYRILFTIGKLFLETRWGRKPQY